MAVQSGDVLGKARIPSGLRLNGVAFAVFGEGFLLERQFNSIRCGLICFAFWGLGCCGPVFGQTLSKGHRILIERGLQTQALVDKGNLFHLDTCRAANFTAVYWMWEPYDPWLGDPPGFPWCRWMGSEQQTLDLLTQEAAYLPSAISLQLGDEQDLNDATVRANNAAWFASVRDSFPNTILYCNSWGGQISNASLDDFIRTSQPDMLSFDTYPFNPGTPIGGSPTNLYGELQRYRKWGLTFDLPCALYTQTFHDYRTRDDSESEMRLNYFAGLAFGFTHFACFTYNTGATSLFNGPGDTNPKPAYYQLGEINSRIRKLGPALTRLRSADVRFINGKHIDPSSGATVSNTTPVDVLNWQFAVNDPWLRGWVVTNLGSKNDGLPGDLVLSWFKPLDESFDGPDFTDEIYMMVTNGLTDSAGSAADCRQNIKLNFLFGTSGITSVQRLRQDTGQLEVIDLPVLPNTGGRRQLSLDYDGGTAELFKFNTGAPFIGAPSTVSTIAPVQGRRGETVSGVAITGSNFVSGLTQVRLKRAGQTDIVADNVAVTGVDSLTCDFTLPGDAEPGLWDVEVTTFSSGTLAEGFGVVPLRQDLDGDNDVDDDDVSTWFACLGGADAAYAASCSLPVAEDGTVAADFDKDHDVDQSDFGVLQRCLSGEGTAPDLRCANR